MPGQSGEAHVPGAPFTVKGSNSSGKQTGQKKTGPHMTNEPAQNPWDFAEASLREDSLDQRNTPSQDRTAPTVLCACGSWAAGEGSRLAVPGPSSLHQSGDHGVSPNPVRQILALPVLRQKNQVGERGGKWWWGKVPRTKHLKGKIKRDKQNNNPVKVLLTNLKERDTTNRSKSK